MPVQPSAANRRPLAAKVDLEQTGVVKRSASGKLSVAFSDIAQTPGFKSDLDTIGRIRKLTKALASSPR